MTGFDRQCSFPIEFACKKQQQNPSKGYCLLFTTVGDASPRVVPDELEFAWSLHAKNKTKKENGYFLLFFSGRWIDHDNSRLVLDDHGTKLIRYRP